MQRVKNAQHQIVEPDHVLVRHVDLREHHVRPLREYAGAHAGAEWRCLPLAAGRLQAVACMWREDATVGMTLDLSPGGDPSEALVSAYDATHA